MSGESEVERMEGDGLKYWLAVDLMADYIGATSAEMATILGLSLEECDTWQSKREMPAAAWARLLAYEMEVLGGKHG